MKEIMHQKDRSINKTDYARAICLVIPKENE